MSRRCLPGCGRGHPVSWPIALLPSRHWQPAGFASVSVSPDLLLVWGRRQHGCKGHDLVQTHPEAS